MANTLRFKRGLASGIPTALAGEPLFTTDTFDLYIGNGTTNTRFQKYIASGATTQILRGDGSLYTFPLAISSPSAGQVLKYNGTSWVNDSDSGITGSGANGRIAFWTGTNTQSSSANLFWDNTNARLGVNTSTPLVPFQIGAGYETSVYDGFRTTNSPTFLISLDSANIYHRILGGSYDNAGTINLDLALTIAKNLNTTNSGYRITSGVGSGASTANGYLAFSALTGQTGETYLATEVMRLTSLNNLHIGTFSSDSGEKLQVTGTMKVTGASTIGGALNVGTSGSLSINAGSAATPLITQTTNYTEIYRRSGGVGIYLGGTGDAANYYDNTAHYFRSSGGGSTYATINSSGNLGIGTTSPGASLHVAGAISSTPTGSGVLMGLQSNYAVVHLNGSDGGLIDFSVSGTDTRGRIIYANASDSMQFGTTNGTTKMTLNASGNLGLGVTPSAWSGTTAFQINQGNFRGDSGAVGISHNAFYNGSSFIYQTSTVATDYYQQSGKHVWQIAGSGTAGNAITFTQAMTLDASGRLGVGTGANSLDAQIVTDGTTSSRINMRGGGTRWGTLYADAGLFAVASTSSIPLVLGTNDTEKMRITTNGNLHIGTYTSDSGEKLQVTGTAKITGALTVQNSITAFDVSYIRKFSGSAQQQIRMQTATDSYASQWALGNSPLSTNLSFAYFNGTSWSADYLTIATTGAATFSSSVTVTGNLTVDTNTLFVDATNNRVGIGTVSPSNKFDIQSANGTAYTSTPQLRVGGGAVNNNRAAILFSDNALSDGRISYYPAAVAASRFFSISARETESDFIINGSGYVGINNSSPAYGLDLSGSARVSDAIAIGTTPDTNNPFKILKNINATVGIKFENTNTSSLAFSAVQLGTDVSGGTKFTNLVYASSGVTASGVYNPDGTSLINNGNGGLNFLGNPIRMYTGGSNGVLRWDISNEGIIQYNATSPTTSATDAYKQYSADVTAGNAAPHFRTENGAVIKLYQETTAVGNSIISLGGGNAVLDDTTFDGYTLRQIVKALRNQGILA